MIRGHLARVQKAWFLAFALFLPAAAHAQNTVVSGRVTAPGGEPIPGAQVAIQELGIGVVTSEDGRYSFVVPAARVRNPNVILVARFVGYKPMPRTITLTGSAMTEDFTLERDLSRLSAVVVTGTAGATEQRKTTFSVTSISADDLPVPGTNPLAALQGRMPGANIVSASGRPGATPSILFRAPTSLDGRGDGQGPLIIVDGIIMNGTLADISSLDIESVEAVRGAAAASLYGARAGKGVIQITTRSGRNAPTGAARFNVRTEYGTSSIERQFKKARNHAYLMQGDLFCNNADCTAPFDYLTELAVENNADVTVLQSPSRSPFIPTDAWTTFQDGEWPTRTYNAIDEVQKNGAFANTDFSVTGRMGSTNYYAALNRSQQEGSIIGLDGFLRNSFRLNVDQRFGSDWSLSVRSQYSQSRQDGNQNEGAGGPFFTLSRMPPNVSLLSRDTLGRRYVRLALDGENSNPLYDLESNDFKRLSDRFLGSATLQYIATPWMDFESTFAVDRANITDEQILEKGYRTLRQDPSNNGFYSTGSFSSMGVNASLQANFRRDFLDRDLQTRFQVRSLFEQQDGLSTNFEGREFAVGGILSGGNLQQTTLAVGSSRNTVRQLGYFAITNLEYKDRYILDVLVRRDGSSLFGSDRRWATFGRASLAWRLSDESWFNVPGITDWKLRLSRGQAGTRPVFAAQFETYSVAGGTVSKANLGNSDIKVQVSTETEIGTDIQLFNRYFLSINRATNVVTDQLVEANLPAAAGFLRQWRNAGTVETEAWEVALNIPVVERPRFSWNVTGHWDQSFANITKLSIPDYQYGPREGGLPLQGAGTMFFAREGERIGTIYGTRFATKCSHLPTSLQGTCATEFQVNDDGYLVWVGAGNSWTEGISNDLWGTPGPSLDAAFGRVGTLSWGAPFTAQDATGNTYQALGNTLPRYRFGISNTITWNDWSFFALLDASIGHKLYNLGRHWSYFEQYSADQDQAGRSDETRKPIGYYGTTGLYGFLQPNSHFVEDASFAKLREFSVSYQIRNLWGVGGDWNVSLIGRNLFTLTNYSGFDPETGRGGGAAASAAINGVDAYAFPNLRTFTFAVSTSF